MIDAEELIKRARAWAGYVKGEYSDEGESLIFELCDALERLKTELNDTYVALGEYIEKCDE